jgi:hypothetical protein
MALLVLIRFVEEPFHLFFHLFDSARRTKAMVRENLEMTGFF